MYLRLRCGYAFSSQLKFLFPSIHSYKESQEVQQAINPLYVQVYKPDSPRIAQQLHRLKVHGVQQGGNQFIYTDKVGIAAGVKDNAFKSGASVCRDARRQNFGNLVFVDTEVKEETFGKFLSGLLQANYVFSKKGEASIKKLEAEKEAGRFSQIENIYLKEEEYNNEAIQQFIKLAYYKSYAKELTNQRQTGDTTFYLNEVKELYKDDSRVQIEYIQGDALYEQGLRLFHAVGRGSIQPPVLINLTYRGNPEDPELHSLVGKGLVFDTGGYHLKPYGSMETMYIDKGGACAVLAAFRGAVEMNLKINVTATVGMAENAIGNTAYKPSEIIQSYHGLTVEINNTDAEGRLVLADCISWTEKNRKPNKMIEVSTLTGACMVALGENTAGLFTNDNKLSEELLSVSDEVYEPLWRLPVTSEHKELMKGQYADLCNVGQGKLVGAQKAAAFLFHFLDAERKIPFAHLDIAGPTDAKADKGINSKGATGFGSQILLRYLIKNQK